MRRNVPIMATVSGALAVALALCLMTACSPGPAANPGEGGSSQAGAQAGPGAQGTSDGPGDPGDPAAAKVASMSLEEKVAQLFIVRPESVAPDDGDITMVDDLVREGLATNTPGGLCYFGENIVTPRQTRALLEETQEAAQAASGLPLFQAVDEEGGTVSRVAGNSSMGVRNVGSMAQIGARGDAGKAYDAAAYIADYLLDLGFNVDFAPVADIADGVGNTMGKRAFDSSAEGVTPMVVAQVNAFNDAGILCSAKHFPGIGRASGDSHEGSIETGRTLEEMESSELVPFRAAIDAGVPMVMVGHISCPGVTGDDTPASLSREVVTGLLREGLGFDGLVVTDSLEMGAVEDVAADEQGVRALAAGCDLVLLPEDYEAAYAGVLAAVRSGELPEEDIDEHATRVVRAKMQLADEADSGSGGGNSR